MRSPPPHLRGLVVAFWELRGSITGRYVGLPKPHSELIVSLSGRHRWFASASGAAALPFEDGWLTPLQACPRFAETSGYLHLVGARLTAPACAQLFGPAAFREPAHPIPLGDLFGNLAKTLRERLIGQASCEARFAVLAGELSARFDQTRDARWLPDIGKIAELGWRVDGLADLVGLSPRGLHKRFISQFGFGPKLWLQLGRFDAVLRAAPHTRSFADLAAAFGYADQPHMNAEFRRFSGHAPGHYRRVRERAAAPDQAPHFVPGAR